MKRLSSYQKLKKEKEEFENLYYKTRKKLHDLGEGIDGDDILMDFDMKMLSVSKEK